jgi:hypothetical protein
VVRHRPAIRYCLDWSEQQHHLAGPLGNALAGRLLDLGWIQRGPHPRTVTLTVDGQAGLGETFGLPVDWDDLEPAALSA